MVVKIDWQKIDRQSRNLTLYALDCGPVIYVGRAANLCTRMLEHSEGNGSHITRQFNPIELLYLVDISVPLRNGKFNQPAANDLERQFACHIAFLTKRPVTICGPYLAPQIDLSRLFKNIVSHKPGDLKDAVEFARKHPTVYSERRSAGLKYYCPVDKPVSEWPVCHYTLSIGGSTKDLLPSEPQAVSVENNGLLQSPSQLLPDANSVQ